MIEKVLTRVRAITFKHRIKSKSKKIKVMGKIFVWNKNVEIGDNVVIHPGAMFWGTGTIKIGNNSVIGKDTIIYAHKKVSIGDNVLVAAQCYIIDCDHGIEKGKLIREQDFISGEVIIENDVWIAAGCKILKNSILRNGVVVGASSVVNGTIEENAICVGTPARVVRYRE